MRQKRLDQDGQFRLQFEHNKKKIYATQSVCGICGRPVDKNLKFPDPMSPCIDHIIPLVRGGHPSDINNLQLAHLCCNRAKEDKLLIKPKGETRTAETITNRNLPQSMDWTKYRSKK